MSRGSHGPSLLTIARRSLLGEARGLDGPPLTGTLLCAVSGGPDSMALLHVLATLADRVGVKVAACGVDHGLRAGAEAELALAGELCSKLAVPFTVVRVKLAEGANLQERARDARYRVLRAEAARVGASLIATAHHADDRAETLILRLLRGAGARGLAVLPPRDGDRVRPLLRARRSDILGHLVRHGLVFAEDPSNASPRFLRARVRHELLPRLTELDPRIVDHLGDLADELCALRPLLGAEEVSFSRRTRQALAVLRASPSTKMTVRLPNERMATYDREPGIVALGDAPPLSRHLKKPPLPPK